MAFNKIINKVFLFAALTAIIFLWGCSYSFTGASVPAHLKTIAIPIFADRSGSGEFDLSEKLTNSVVQKFIEDNSLSIADKLKTDSILNGTIVRLSDAPAVVTGGDNQNIATRRLTITVRVVYKDLIKRTTIFEKDFSNYGDYQTSGDLMLARNNAIDDAISKISEDILLGVVSNW